MASYTAKQYADQQRTTKLINWANSTGLCPHCKVRPRGVWADGVQMATCGRDECLHGWLRIHPRRTVTIELSYSGEDYEELSNG
jgi:hypothetical protein